MLRKLNVATDDIPRTKFRLHIAIGSLVALTFILIIARVADSGTPRTRTNTWGIAVVSLPKIRDETALPNLKLI